MVYRKLIPDRRQIVQSFFGIVISLKLHHRQELMKFADSQVSHKSNGL